MLIIIMIIIIIIIIIIITNNNDNNYNKTDLFRMYIFSNADHVLILRGFDILPCSLKRVHVNMNIFACTLFNEQEE